MQPHRKRLKRWETDGPRFLTFSCHNRLPLLNHPESRDTFARFLAKAHARLDFTLIAWVVMPEHAHLIVVPTRDCPVGRILTAIKQPVAQSALRRWRDADAPVLAKLAVPGNRHRFWQAGGGFDRLIRTNDELDREIAYIHHNPLRRGLADTPTDWPWSSARWYAGDHTGPIPLTIHRWR